MCPILSLSLEKIHKVIGLAVAMSMNIRQCRKSTITIARVPRGYGVYSEQIKEMSMKKLSIAVFLLVSLAGCTTAGPYVTNISSDGNNGLNIEKCAVQFNSFTGAVSNTDCTSQSVKLSRN